MDADSLGLVLAVVGLHTDEVGICCLIEGCPYCQHMFIGLVYGLH